MLELDTHVEPLVVLIRPSDVPLGCHETVRMAVRALIEDLIASGSPAQVQDGTIAFTINDDDPYPVLETLRRWKLDHCLGIRHEEPDIQEALWKRPHGVAASAFRALAGDTN